MQSREEKLEYKRNYMKQWNQKNAEKLKEKRKSKSKELAIKTKKWSESHPNYYKEYAKKKREENREESNKKQREYYHANIESYRKSSRIYAKKWTRQNPINVMISSAKRRAKKLCLPFTITKKDIIIPEFCPILGIPIVQGEGFGPCDSSPSIDRIIPSKGYVPENIAVISFRANRIKNEGSAEEHQKIVEWIKSKITTV